MAQKRRSPRTQALLQFGLFCGSMIFLNILASTFYGHLDLTQEKRFTLASPTKQLLRGLKDRIYVEILLEGDFPAGFKRLQTAARETLDDFRSESGYVDYAFEDPSLGSVEDINARRKTLSEIGVNPVNLKVQEQGESSQKLIYPVAIFHYGSRQIPVKLLENESPSLSPDAVINNSVSLLEYKFANAIKKLLTPLRPVILFTEGHGELAEIQTADLERTLRQFYDTDHVNLDSLIELPTEASLKAKGPQTNPNDTTMLRIAPPCALLVVAKPQRAFSERDKFKIDQYVMNGGKVVWLLDRYGISLDSLRVNGHFVPVPYELNLDDLLFKYGARVQNDLIVDLEASQIPLQTGQLGNAPQLELFKWYYHPSVFPNGQHPIVKNLDQVDLRFCSSLDTIRTKTPVKKTILLRSSKYSRLQFPPMDINFDILRYEPDPTKFDKGLQNVGVLLEGSFPSNFENRVPEAEAAALRAVGVQFKTSSIPTSMVVISDGDVAANHVRTDPATGKNNWLPLGFNHYEKRQYANKELMLNAIEYLADPNGVIGARTKEVKLRLLDQVKIKNERGIWQAINIGVPLLLLAVFGLLYRFLRKWRYAKAT